MGGDRGGTQDVGRRQCSMMAMPAKRFTCATLSQFSLGSHAKHVSTLGIMPVTCLEQPCRTHAAAASGSKSSIPAPDLQLTQEGAGLPVSFVQSSFEKWLQLRSRRW